MQVVSQVAERLKTHDPRKLGNIRKMSKYVGDRPQFLPEIKLL